MSSVRNYNRIVLQLLVRICGEYFLRRKAGAISVIFIFMSYQVIADLTTLCARKERERVWNSDWQLGCTTFFLFSFTFYLLEWDEWMSALQCGRRSSLLREGFFRRWERRTSGCLWGELVSLHCCPGLSHTLTFVCAVPCKLRHDELPAARCMPCGSVALELLSPLWLYLLPHPHLSICFLPFMSRLSLSLPPLCSSRSNYLSWNPRHTAPRCSTFSLFLYPLASSSPPLIGGLWCPEGLWISVPSSS